MYLGGCKLEFTVKIPLLGIRLRKSKTSIKIYTFISFYELKYYRIPRSILALLISALPGLLLYYSSFLQTALDFFHTDNINIVPSIIGVIGISLATLGWIATVIVSQRLSRKQHTVNLLVSHNFSNDYRELTSTFLSKYPDKIFVSKNDAQELINCTSRLLTAEEEQEKKTLNAIHDVFKSLRSLLNYYEFIATGLKYGDLDKRLIHDYFCSTLCLLCEKSREYILARRIKNKDPTLYENLVDLYRAWKPSDTFPEL